MRVSLPQKPLRGIPALTTVLCAYRYETHPASETLRGTLALTMVLFAYRYESQCASETPARHSCSHNGRIKLPLCDFSSSFSNPTYFLTGFALADIP